MSKTFGQAASGGALSGYECIVCDALKLSKLGGQDQPGWFSNFLFLPTAFLFSVQCFHYENVRRFEKSYLQSLNKCLTFLDILLHLTPTQTLLLVLKEDVVSDNLVLSPFRSAEWPRYHTTQTHRVCSGYLEIPSLVG